MIQDTDSDDGYSDEILDEICRIKDELAAKYDYDVRRLGEALRREQRESGLEYVTLPGHPTQTPGSPKA